MWVDDSTRGYIVVMYQAGEYPHGSLLEETNDLVSRKLEAKIRRQSHQRIAVRLQRIKKTRARLIQDRVSYTGKNLAVGSFLATPMRCSEEDYPNRVLTDLFVPWLDTRLKQCLRRIRRSRLVLLRDVGVPV
jgi:hypothetical protein